MDINKFTEKAREAVTQAQSIAVGMGHQDIDSEHLALALIRQEQGIVPRILDQMGVQTAALAVAVEEKLRKRPSVSGGGMDPNRISITQRLAKVLGDAENESRRMKDEYVSVDHLFAALAENAPGTPLGEVFKEYNISRASFGQAMESLRGGARVTSPNPEDTVEALSKYARDLVEAARQGKMDPVIGRDAEIRRVVRILSRRTKNNPVLIGEAGVGKTAIVPVLGREIPIIADSYVDREFGTGALKVTPCHDHNDWALGKKHDLEFLQVIDEDGIMKAESGPYAGLKKEDCRTKIVADIKAAGDLLAVEDLDNSVGHCYRCHTVVEPHVSTQWFVATTKMAPAARKAVPELTRILPESWAKTYYHWLDNIRDWCISRQIWWGHRIPAWTCAQCGELIVAEHDPSSCPKCGCTDLKQDEDVLDTWFSSALWPFSTMGWPEQTKDLATWYPTSVLVTGFDIIFFWVARMMMMGQHFMGQVPFHDVYLHALVRDETGRKMSKSTGNVIDPLEMIDKYGCDSLRFTLTAFAAMGRDIRLSEARIEGYRHFVNKLWNAARFALMNLPETAPAPVALESVEGLHHQWILHRLEQVKQDMDKALEEYRFNDAAQLGYKFLWNEFCDWYLELIKPDMQDEARKPVAQYVLWVVLRELLLLLHPIIPFVTAEIWNALPVPAGEQPTDIALELYPAARPGCLHEAEAARMELVQGIIVAVRTIKAELNISPSHKVSLMLHPVDEAQAALLESCRQMMTTLARLEDLQIGADLHAPKASASSVVGGCQVIVPLKGAVDLAGELARLDKEMAKLEKDLVGVQSKLHNESFVSRAPAQVVERERARAEQLLDAKAKMQALRQRFSEALNEE